MFCSNCGSQIPDHAHFCDRCGKPVTQPAAPAPQPQYIPQPQIQYAAPAPAYAQTYASAPAPSKPAPNSFAQRVREAAKQVAGSPLFLIVTIMYTLIQLFNLLFPQSGISYLLNSLSYELGLNLEVVSDFAKVSSSSAFNFLFSTLPILLILTGLWVIYGTAKSKTSTSTAGLSIIRVITTLQMLFLCIVMSILLIACFVALYNVGSSYDSYYSSAAEDNLYGVIFILPGITALFIVYYVKIFATIAAVKNAIEHGKPDTSASGFLAVFCFIMAFFQLISLLSSAAVLTGASKYLSPHAGFVTLFPSVLNIAISICFGILIFKFKSKMNQLASEAPAPAPVYTQPAYAAPVYTQPVAPVYTQPAAPVVPEVVAAPEVVNAPQSEN